MSRRTPEDPQPYPGDLPASGITEPGAQPEPYPGDAPLSLGDPSSWAQPEPYPGDLLVADVQPVPYAGDTVAATTRPAFRREYLDPLGRPMSGLVILRREDGASFDATVTDGVLEVPLEQGTYRLVAQLEQVDGRAHYQTDTITVEAYW